MSNLVTWSTYLKSLSKEKRKSYDGLCRCISCEEIRLEFNRLCGFFCRCGHLKFKHLYDGNGGCNEFKCVCDSFVSEEKHSLENANAVDTFPPPVKNVAVSK